MWPNRTYYEEMLELFVAIQEEESNGDGDSISIQVVFIAAVAIYNSGASENEWRDKGRRPEEEGSEGEEEDGGEKGE